LCRDIGESRLPVEDAQLRLQDEQVETLGILVVVPFGAG
jgi:hypothetical protein